MSDDKTNRGPADRRLVNANEPYELKHVQEQLGVSREEVLEAIQEVGNEREKIEEYLKNKPNR